MSRPLTSLRARVLRALDGEGPFTVEQIRERCGGNIASPHVIANALVRLGLATVVEHVQRRRLYSLTDAGRAALAAMAEGG